MWLADSVNWHALSIGEVLDRLKTSGRGLSSPEAARRLAEYGANHLRVSPPASAWSILVAQFRSVVVGLLGAATVVSAATGDYADAGAIAAVLALNAALGFATEREGPGLREGRTGPDPCPVEHRCGRARRGTTAR